MAQTALLSGIAVLLVCVALHVLPVLLLVALAWLSANTTRHVFAAIDRSGLCARDKGLATISLINASRVYPLWYQALAPVVMFYALWFVPRSANRLSALWRKWDNDEGINAAGETYIGSGDPRSWLARWIWLGWRNRAVQADLDVGAPMHVGSSIVDGDPNISEGRAGYLIERTSDDYWRVAIIQKLGPLCIRRNYGWKNRPHVQHVQHVQHVRPVVIGFSLKRWRAGHAA